jgi:hypothetical protein
MLGMSLSLGCYQRCEQRHYLSQAQKLGLKQLLLLEQKLKHPEYPNVVKGLEGMQTAHQILQERGASGVLIGGLAESVWNQRRKPEDLYKNKDVDVAVLDDHFELGDNFEGGVDWWIPQNGEITLRSDASRVEGIQKKWYENGNGVILSFGVNRNTKLNPGLYIPDSEWVVDMREYEADANVDYGRVEAEFDEDVFEKFRDKVRERVKTRLPRFVREAFADYVLSPHYEGDYDKRTAVDLERFDLETIRAIKGLESVVEKEPTK